MIKEQECEELLLHLTAALYMGTPIFSQIERKERPAKRVQVAVIETLNYTKVQA